MALRRTIVTNTAARLLSDGQNNLTARNIYGLNLLMRVSSDTHYYLNAETGVVDGTYYDAFNTKDDPEKVLSPLESNSPLGRLPLSIVHVTGVALVAVRVTVYGEPTVPDHNVIKYQLHLL